jgi:hypothetical protein
MMRLFGIIAICAILFVLASLAALYSYGRFAKQARGAPSTASPVAESDTRQDHRVKAQGTSERERIAAYDRQSLGIRDPRACRA